MVKDQLISRIREKEAHVAVIGLGADIAAQPFLAVPVLPDRQHGRAGDP